MKIIKGGRTVAFEINGSIYKVTAGQLSEVFNGDRIFQDMEYSNIISFEYSKGFEVKCSVPHKNLIENLQLKSSRKPSVYLRMYRGLFEMIEYSISSEDLFGVLSSVEAGFVPQALYFTDLIEVHRLYKYGTNCGYLAAKIDDDSMLLLEISNTHLKFLKIQDKHKYESCIERTNLFGGC